MHMYSNVCVYMHMYWVRVYVCIDDLVNDVYV